MLGNDFQKDYLELKNGYGIKLKQKLDEIIQLEAVLFNESSGLEEYTEFYKLIHKISGSSGMFGFDKVSEKSNDLELVLKRIMNTLQIPTKEESEQIKIFISLLKDALMSIENE